MQLTKSFCGRAFGKDTSVKGIAAKISLVVFPIFLLVTAFTLLTDLALAIANCITKSNESSEGSDNLEYIQALFPEEFDAQNPQANNGNGILFQKQADQPHSTPTASSDRVEFPLPSSTPVFLESPAKARFEESKEAESDESDKLIDAAVQPFAAGRPQQSSSLVTHSTDVSDTSSVTSSQSSSPSTPKKRSLNSHGSVSPQFENSGNNQATPGRKTRQGFVMSLGAFQNLQIATPEKKKK